MKITRRMKPEYFFTDADISDYLATIIFHKLGGYAFINSRNASYLLTNIDSSNIFLGSDGKNYSICLTPSVDTYSISQSIDYYLNKYGPIVLDLEGKIICGNLEAMEAERVDVFDEFATQLEQSGGIDKSSANLKILFPLNKIDLTHWVLAEINIHKQGMNYNIQFNAHDPLGAGAMPSANFYYLAQSLIYRINKLHEHSVELPKINIENFKSPYKKRQQDGNACGVIVATDTIKILSGKSIDDQDPLPLPYTPNAPEIRLHCIKEMMSYLPVNDATRIAFLERNCNTISIEPVQPPRSSTGLTSILKKTQLQIEDTKKEKEKEKEQKSDTETITPPTSFAKSVIEQRQESNAAKQQSICVIM